MNLKQMEYFITIVNEGSISAASKILHISQPPLSTQMKLLEQELGVTLFERGSRAIALTHAGKVFYDRAQGILDMTGAARQELEQMGRGLHGFLRLGMVSSTETSSIIGRIADFRSQHPGIYFRIYEGNTYQLMDKLNTGLIEAAIVRTPFPEDSYECSYLAEEPMMAVGMPGHFPDTAADSISLEQESVLAYRLFAATAITFLKCSLPLLLSSMALGIAAHGVQTRFNISFKTLKPKFDRLYPISGIKKMFAVRNAVELLKNLLKIAVLGVLLFNLIKGDIVQVARMIDVEPLNSCIHLLQMAFQLILKVCMVFVIVAFFDFLYQRWEYEKNLKMTKQEVKDEYKQTEGNPEIKGRIRRIQRQMALSRMIQKVPEADVIVRNPTHVAVALKYDPKRHGAPVVLAKGQDELALRIVKAGEENGVFMIENKPLARALYASCRLDQEIPAEFYGAVAEILIYIYRASHREDMFQ